MDEARKIVAQAVAASRSEAVKDRPLDMSLAYVVDYL